MRAFLAQESASGLLLIAAAVLAMIVANSPLSPIYFHSLHMMIGPLGVQHWINDGLMALFFLIVGLEIKREFLDGHLSTWADRRLPFLAAAAGMAVPALVYLSLTRGDPALARGWAIPAATDIAFALGLLALLGKRAPTSLKLFLTTVAIVDDVGAVVVIAIFYTANLNVIALGAALGVLAGMFAMNRAGVKHPAWYFAAFTVLWCFTLLSGVHATVAGVLAATAVPIKVTLTAPEAEDTTLHRMEHAVHPWVAFLVVPMFGFANAGVALSGGFSPVATLPLAITLGLFVGKQVGVFGSVWLAVKAGVATRPAGASWYQVYGVSLLCGIGFTMSLFIGGLAFPEAPQADAVKIGVLTGSLLSAAAGVLILRLASAAQPAR